MVCSIGEGEAGFYRRARGAEVTDGLIMEVALRALKGQGEDSMRFRALWRCSGTKWHRQRCSASGW